MHRLTMSTLRLLLATAIAVSLATQAVALPWLAGLMADDYPEYAALRYPVLVAAILAVACGQVVLVCLWRLLDLVADDAIFDPRAFRWVDRMIAAIIAAAGVVLATLLYTAPTVQQPGVSLAAIGMLWAGAVVVLVLVVMRGLLRRASTMRSDLAGVI